jgi:hypothetical protein
MSLFITAIPSLFNQFGLPCTAGKILEFLHEDLMTYLNNLYPYMDPGQLCQKCDDLDS